MRRSSPGAVVPLLIVLAWSLAPDSLAGQIELGPSVGVYWPVGGWTSEFGEDVVERRQLTATLLSVRAAYWTSRRLGVEGTFGYSPSQVAVSDIGGTQDITSGVWLSSARLLYHLGTLQDGRPDSFVTNWEFNAGLGVGVVSRGGSAWANHTGTTYPAAVVTFETRTPFFGPVKLRLLVEDFVAAPTFNKDRPAETQGRIHQDVLFSLMAVVRLGPAR